MTDQLTQHHLRAEWVHDQDGTAIMLTQQEGLDEPETVLAHPWQLRAVCEQFGIIAQDAQSARTIATLQRRMTALRERIDSLADWMARHSDHQHADLSYETTQLGALQDLASEWCAEFATEPERAVQATECTRTPAQCADALPAPQGLF